MTSVAMLMWELLMWELPLPGLGAIVNTCNNRNLMKVGMRSLMEMITSEDDRRGARSVE